MFGTWVCHRLGANLRVPFRSIFTSYEALPSSVLKVIVRLSLMTNVNSQIEAKQNSDSAQQVGIKLQKRRSNDPVTMMLLIIAVVLLS